MTARNTNGDCVQIREAEERNDRDATNDTDLERGNTCREFEAHVHFANDELREDMVVDGKSGRNKCENIGPPAPGYHGRSDLAVVRILHWERDVWKMVSGVGVLVPM